MYTVKTKIASAAPAVSLDAVKSHLRIDGNFEDSALENLTAAATDMLEQNLRRVFVTRTLELTAFNERVIRLPYAPDPEILSVESGGLPLTGWTLEGNTLFLNGTHKSVVVLYKAGFGGADDVPPAIKQEILNVMLPMYERRGTNFQSEIDAAVKRLSPYRLPRI